MENEIQEAVRKELMGRISAGQGKDLNVLFYQYRVKKDPRAPQNIYLEKFIPGRRWVSVGNINRYPPEIRKLALELRGKIDQGKARQVDGTRFYEIQELKKQIHERMIEEHKNTPTKKTVQKNQPLPKTLPTHKSDLEKQKESYEKSLEVELAKPKKKQNKKLIDELREGLEARIQTLNAWQQSHPQPQRQPLTPQQMDSDIGMIQQILSGDSAALEKIKTALATQGLSVMPKAQRGKVVQSPTKRGKTVQMPGPDVPIKDYTVPQLQVLANQRGIGLKDPKTNKSRSRWSLLMLLEKRK